jgi:four helix bundle protein
VREWLNRAVSKTVEPERVPWVRIPPSPPGIERRKDKGEGRKVLTDSDLKERTKDFAIRVVRLFAALPKTTEAQVLGKQLLRCGTPVGAQYREAQHAKSNADFISKIKGSLQELEETSYWLELIEEMKFFEPTKLRPLREETKELIAIFVTIAKRLRENRPELSPLSLSLYTFGKGAGVVELAALEML